MNKEKVLKIVLYVIMLISVIFIIYAMAVLQNVENQCNTHLKEKYESLMEDCKLAEEPEIPYIDIDLPIWLG